MKRDTVAIGLVEVSGAADLHHPERQGSFDIDVDRIDAPSDGLNPAPEGLPRGRARAPYDQAHGQCEFHVADEDCTLGFFGETIGRG